MPTLDDIIEVSLKKLLAFQMDYASASIEKSNELDKRQEEWILEIIRQSYTLGAEAMLKFISRNRDWVQSDENYIREEFKKLTKEV